MIVAVPSKSYFASTKNLTQILMKHPMKLCESRGHKHNSNHAQQTQGLWENTPNFYYFIIKFKGYEDFFHKTCLNSLNQPPRVTIHRFIENIILIIHNTLSFFYLIRC